VDIGERDGQRIALDRIDRQRQAEAGGHRARIAAEGEHVAICAQHLVLDTVGGDAHAGDVSALLHEFAHFHAIAEAHAGILRHLREPGGEELAVAGFVVRQTQAAGELAGPMRERGLGLRERSAGEQLVGHAALFQHGDVARCGVELGLGAEQLQRAAAAFFIVQAGVLAQAAQAVAAVLGYAHHALLVHRVTCARAVAQHLHHPAQLEQAAVGADRERRVALKQPLNAP